jgi:DMSO/TMAO reductase YedYZ molybdopterin-dependent catalytic subunit
MYSHDGRFSADELRLATRNRGMPLEALRYDITPAGLHYLLVHYDIPTVDPVSWRLKVHGDVRKPLELSLDELRAIPSVRFPVTMECAGNGRSLYEPRRLSQPWFLEAIGTAEWTGLRLSELLARAGVKGSAVEFVFRGVDHGIEGGEHQDYARSLTVADAMRPEVILAYEMNGLPLPPQHGFPLRLVVPGWYGMASVKWLGAIEAVSKPFTGYQMDSSYRFSSSDSAPGPRVSRIRVRALMAPPGVPDFFTRRRAVGRGKVEVTGRAWSGQAPVTRVEFSPDGGRNWEAAGLGRPLSEYAWTPWAITWDALPGEHTVLCRATDAAGNTQPESAEWNTGGYGNNAMQRVDVTVT